MVEWLVRPCVPQQFSLLVFRNVRRHPVLDVHGFGDQVVLGTHCDTLLELLEVQILRLVPMVVRVGAEPALIIDFCSKGCVGLGSSGSDNT